MIRPLAKVNFERELVGSGGLRAAERDVLANFRAFITFGGAEAAATNEKRTALLQEIYFIEPKV